MSHRGNTSGLSFVTDIRGDVTLRVAAFVPASEPHLAPAPIFASHDLGSAAPWPGPFMVFRSNTLHMAGQVQVAARVANQQPPRLSIRALRIPFATASPTTITIDHGAVNDLIFGKNAPTDAAGDLVTYEVSGTAVNKHGDAIYVYGRTGIVTARLFSPRCATRCGPTARASRAGAHCFGRATISHSGSTIRRTPRAAPDPRRDGEDIHHARVPQDRLRDGGRRSGRRRDLLDHPRIRGQRRRLTRRSVLDRGRGARQRDVAVINAGLRVGHRNGQARPHSEGGSELEGSTDYGHRSRAYPLGPLVTRGPRVGDYVRCRHRLAAEDRRCASETRANERSARPNSEPLKDNAKSTNTQPAGNYVKRKLTRTGARPGGATNWIAIPIPSTTCTEQPHRSSAPKETPKHRRAFVRPACARFSTLPMLPPSWASALRITSRTASSAEEISPNRRTIRLTRLQTVASPQQLRVQTGVR